MATTISFKNPDWDLNKSKYDETDTLPLMKTPGPVLMILATYLLFVLKVGPAFMRKREGFKLTNTLVVYNGLQVALSFYMVQKYARALLEHGILSEECLMDRNEVRSQVLFGIWIYFAAKITELLDTVFFVLRKKDSQVTFLHLYHHSVMMIGTWAYLKYAPSDNVTFIGFFNSLVHVFMYTYYGLSAFGPNVAKYLTWKKYMTSFQLIQFVSVFFQYLLTLKYSQCPPSRGVAVFFACNILFFLLLFSNFYRQSYSKQRASRSNGITCNIELKPISNGRVVGLKAE